VCSRTSGWVGSEVSVEAGRVDGGRRRVSGVGLGVCGLI
jgi:hypothetical protein